MPETFPHLPLQREEPITEKRARPGRPFEEPENPAEHGRKLKKLLGEAKTEASRDIDGFDERRLLRFTVEKGFSPDELTKISRDFEFVSQEDDNVIIAFASTPALDSFEASLTSLIEGGHVKYKNILYALKGIAGWSAEDRSGWALKQEGFPEAEPFVIDVELWPLEDNQGERVQLWESFERWLSAQGMSLLDSVKNEGLSLFRVRATTAQANTLLHHRDVRTVDLPPKYGLDISLRRVDLQNLPEISAPPQNAPGIVVLDSGITTGHPILAPAIGDAQSFLLGKDETDEHGHGTLVAGLALYGNLESEIRDGGLSPKLRIFSGRILDEKNENNTGFIENQVKEAVEYFVEEYGCRIFNLSFGDRNKPYLGGHIRGLAYTLDSLSRDLKVLFVVSAGNVLGSQLDGRSWRERYPSYLTEDSWALIDPATALNALTVGSIARYDSTFNSGHHQDDPSEVPIARKDQPSPFTRHGHSAGGALKPDFVEYGGNWALNTRAAANNLVSNSGLGELSSSIRYMQGQLFADESGTSMAAPQLAFLAGKILEELPDATPDLIRALLAVNARIPEAAATLFENKNDLLKVCGFGKVQSGGLFRSLEEEATMVATANIANKRHHFYEVPIPQSLLSRGSRTREISVALAHSPYVRSTRVSYKATRMDFRVIASKNLSEVVSTFNKATSREDYEHISELPNASVSPKLRDKGTLQAATWVFRQITANSNLTRKKLFVVVTRNDFSWGEAYSMTEEPYSLVVSIKDRENTEARLYSEIRALIQVRARARIRP